MIGHRAIYHDGWRAVCPWPGPCSPKRARLRRADHEEKLPELDAKGWELYDVAKDFAETHNVAVQNRARLIEMIALWYVEAGKYNVLPIEAAARRGSPTRDRS